MHVDIGIKRLSFSTEGSSDQNLTTSILGVILFVAVDSLNFPIFCLHYSSLCKD